MNGKLSIIISVILVTAAILTVQSSSMLQISYAQSCPDGSTPDASGNCPTEAPPAGDGETAEAPPAGDGETAEAPPATETPPPAAPPAGASQGSNNTNFVNTILEIMNRERAAVGVPPLAWSDTLAAGSQTWADYLATLNKGFHATDAEKGGPFGETVAVWGPHNPIDVNATLMPMLNFWINEKSNYVPGTPINSGTIGPNGKVYGHYTQIVWRNEQEVGCGMATGSIQNEYGQVNDFLVCRYNLPGNWLGELPY